MRSWLRNASFLLLVGCALGVMGLLGGDLYKLLSFLSFTVFLFTFSGSFRVLGITAPIPLGLAAVFIAGSILAAIFAHLGVFYFYFLLTTAVFVLFNYKKCPDAAELATYAVALAVVGITAELIRDFPVLWHAKMGAASMLSNLSEVISREERNLGPTAMGLPLLGTLLALSCVRAASGGSFSFVRMVKSIFILILVHLLYLAGLKFYAQWISNYHVHSQWLLLNSQHLFVILGASAFTLLDRKTRLKTFSGRRSLSAVITVVLVAASGIIVSAALGYSHPPEKTKTRVMIYDAGYLNWFVPVHGKYGEHSAGMFGLLPPTLRASGFEVAVNDDLAILAGSNPPDCVIMINIQKYFDKKDKQIIWKYVEKGGGLLCLGDHTGVAGIRGPFNDLLEPVGIRFLFDSATFFGSGWNGALELRNHPLNFDIKSEEDFQIWVGASLDLDLKSRPVIIGRYGFSDTGNPADIRRSFLGDRRYNPGELLGDIVLAADAEYGRGKVLVFGDTSGYQNLSLSRSLDSVMRSLQFLSQEKSRMLSVASQLIWLLLLFTVLSAALFANRSTVPLIALALGLCIGSAAASIAHPGGKMTIPSFITAKTSAEQILDTDSAKDLAVLDCSHGLRFSLHAWQDKSIGGLQLNLARNGYFLLIKEDFPYDLLPGSKVLLIIAPCKKYEPREIAAIEKFIISGGRAVITTGFEELSGSKELLAHFGINITNIPLGQFTVESAADSLEINFHEAWPVEIEPGAGTNVLLSKWGYPLAVTSRIGRGELLVIGDSSFFHDVNLESRDRYFAGNVAFLRKLAERWRTK